MMRKIMTAAELANYHVAREGRSPLSDGDGYSDIEVNEGRGYHAVGSWGRNGWDLGDWPYVVLSTCDRSEGFLLLSVCEGDHDLYSFSSEEDRNAALDYLFLWYGARQDWCPITEEQRTDLDAGRIEVDEKFRGPFSWGRLEREKNS
jgi:hypothetical protein